MDLVFSHLLHPDFVCNSREEDVADHHKDEERHPPAPVAAFDIFEGFRWRGEGVRHPLHLGETGSCFARLWNCQITHAWASLSQVMAMGAIVTLQGLVGTIKIC